MPTLTCTFDDNLVSYLADDEITQEDAQEMIDEIHQLSEDLLDAVDDELVEFVSLVDGSGRYYQKLALVPQVAYVLGGRLYVSAGDWTVDVTSQAEAFQKALPYLPREVFQQEEVIVEESVPEKSWWRTFFNL